jgi:hypothetical protein
VPGAAVPGRKVMTLVHGMLDGHVLAPSRRPRPLRYTGAASDAAATRLWTTS